MRGCSPEVASRIVALLMADVGIGRVYTSNPMATTATPAATQAKQPTPRPTRRKVTPAVSAFILSVQHLKVPEILNQLKQRFGVQLGQATIYKEWQSRHLYVPPGPPHPHQAGPSGRRN